MEAEIIDFPQPVVAHCSACDHALVGVRGIYCSFWHEEVDEKAALDCEEYDPW